MTDALPVPPPSLENAAEIINAGTKVAILAGRGCLTARDEILCSRKRWPRRSLNRCRESGRPGRYPYTTGGIGLFGTAPSQDAMEECDTLIIAGSSFPYLEFYPKPGQAKTVQIDIDLARIGLRYQVDVGLVGQSWDVLRALLPLIHPKKDRTFLDGAGADAAVERIMMDAREHGHAAEAPSRRPSAQWVSERRCDHLLRYRHDDHVGRPAHQDQGHHAIFRVGDTGLYGQWPGLQYGASIAFPGRQVVCFAGDGGFTMLMGELATVKKYQLPVKIIVIKNNLYGMIKWEQIAFEGNPQYGVQLDPIDFAAFAKACGVPGIPGGGSGIGGIRPEGGLRGEGAGAR